MNKCNFDIKGVCYALGCWSSEKCGARDDKGYPKYCDNETLKEKMGAEHIELMMGVAPERIKESK